MVSEIHNGMDLIDSREIIARVNDLTNDKEILEEALNEVGDDDEIEKAQEEYDTFLGEYEDELDVLNNLVEQASGSPDWVYGGTLIRDSYFEEYAQDLAEDIGVIDRNGQWPLDCIDWEKAADELKQDYMCVDFDGVEYWILA